MGRFSDAKIWGAIDAKFQKAYNYLIDLLDTGYSTESTIGGHKVKIDINPTVGFTIKSDNGIIGGITDIGGVLSSISQIITNQATDPGCWASIGSNDVDGTDGIFLFSKIVSPTVPAIKILIGRLNGGIYIIDKNNKQRFYAESATIISDADGHNRFYADDALTIISDGTGQNRFVASENVIVLYDSVGTPFFWADTPGNFVQLLCPSATNNAIGVDATGAYKITAGVKTYL